MSPCAIDGCREPERLGGLCEGHLIDRFRCWLDDPGRGGFEAMRWAIYGGGLRRGTRRAPS